MEGAPMEGAPMEEAPVEGAPFRDVVRSGLPILEDLVIVGNQRLDIS